MILSNYEPEFVRRACRYVLGEYPIFAAASAKTKHRLHENTGTMETHTGAGFTNPRCFPYEDYRGISIDPEVKILAVEW